MARRTDFKDLVSRLPASERVSRAKKCVEALTYRVVEVIDIDANVEILVFSNKLSKLIPRSYAANAFVATQTALFRYEVIKLLSLWDTPDDNTISIPTVVDLISSADVIAMLQEDHFIARADRPVSNLNPGDDPDIEAAIQESMRSWQINLAATQAERARTELAVAIETVENITETKALVSIRNLRDHLAHSFEKTKRELRQEIPPIRYSDVPELLDRSIRLIEDLYLWVNGVSFDLSGDVRNISRRNAEELWGNCAFTIPAR